MMSSLWTASSGMKAMQFSVDTISNNLANVATNAFKKERPEFEDMLYTTMQKAYAGTDSSKPVNLQLGHGVVARAVARDFTAGNLEQTDNKLDFAIEGEGFFAVKMPDGVTRYTRDGTFKISPSADGNMLTTSQGFPVLDREGNSIVFTQTLAQIEVQPSGEMTYKDETGTAQPTGQYIGLFQFDNVQGLEATGGNFYLKNSASGEPVADQDRNAPSSLRGGYVESSNVKVVEEMVKLITAQRAYDLNSKAITTSDEMLQTANNLRR